MGSRVWKEYENWKTEPSNGKKEIEKTEEIPYKIPKRIIDGNRNDERNGNDKKK